MHGRPESTFMLEATGKMPVFSFIEQVPYDKRYKAFITFWEEFLPLWGLLLPSEKLHYVPAPINLKEFTPIGDRFEFGDRAGEPNLVITDMWREDETPFNVIMAAAEFKRQYCPTAKLHIFGLPESKQGAVAVLARALDRQGIWGHCFTLHNEMPTIYRAADILLTPHIIATRVIREACASGIPVIAGTGCKYTPFTANPKDTNGYAAMIQKVWSKIQDQSIHNSANGRDIATHQFDMKKSGQAMTAIFEKVLAKYSPAPKPKMTGRKVLVDIGGHIGESIQNFYRQVDHAAEYYIYTFEPNPAAFRELTANTQQLSNVQRIEAAVGIEDTVADLYIGFSSMGDGSTLMQGKRTGSIDYHKPIRVQMIDFVRWFNENIYPHDQVVVKMNIEGSEYPILVQMLSNGLLARIHRLYVQLHSHKFENPETFKFVDQQLIDQAERYPNCTVEISREGVFSFEGLNNDEHS
jgi:FkbM family methyltransferase